MSSGWSSTELLEEFTDAGGSARRKVLEASSSLHEQIGLEPEGIAGGEWLLTLARDYFQASI